MIPEIQHMQKLSLSVGDVVVLTTDQSIYKEDAEDIKEAMTEVLEAAGMHNHVIVLTGGMKIGVLSNE